MALVVEALEVLEALEALEALVGTVAIASLSMVIRLMAGAEAAMISVVVLFTML
jgi:hypothetical protein